MEKLAITQYSKIKKSETMPKRSKEDTQITIDKIMDTVVDQLIQLGYERMSYTTLSNQSGVSRTGISHHFPKKSDFIDALDGRIFKKLLEFLHVDGTVDEFVTSWNMALKKEKEFRAFFRLVMHHTSTTKRSSNYSANTLTRLEELVSTMHGKDQVNLDALLGKTMIHLAITAE